MKKFIILCVLFSALTALPFAHAAENANSLILQSWEGEGSSIARAQNFTIRSQDEWLAAWRRTDHGMTHPLLKNQMAVALFSGEHLTSGYVIRVLDITEDEHALKVVHQDLKPKQTNMAANPYTTYPWTIALLPANAKPVIFEKVGSAFWYRAYRSIIQFFDALFVSGFNGKPQEN